MKKLIIPLVLLALFVFAVPCSAVVVPNLFVAESRVPVDSEIDPWDLFFINDEGKAECSWNLIDFFPCPQNDGDSHIVITNPDLEAEIKVIELVIGDDRLLPFGVLCSYSYMKDGKWHMFLQDFDKDRFVRYKGEGGHGGSHFGRDQ